MDNNLTIYRRRFIPNELRCLDKDEILSFENGVLITKWKSLRKRPDFEGGTSAYFLDKGWKISRVVDISGKITYWYCDIIDVIFDDKNHSLTYEDLLFDVVVYESGKIRVLDCDEAADAFEKNLITKEQIIHALRAMHELLTLIREDRFDRLQAIINDADPIN